MLVCVTLLNACTGKPNLEVDSPDNTVQLTFQNGEQGLTYQLDWNNKSLVDASQISILPNIPVKIIDTEIKTENSNWKPVWGQFSDIKDHYNELVIRLEINGKSGKLYARVYNDGVGFRFERDNISSEDTLDFFAEYNLPSKDMFYAPAGENPPIGPLSIGTLTTSEEKLPKLALPIVVEKSNKMWLSFLESDLYSAKGFNTMKLHFNKETGKLTSSSKPKASAGKLVTPWKVILFGYQAGDLVTSTVTVNLAAPCEIENPDWIKPGKTLWDWRVHGYTAPDGFVYGINTESYKRFIDFAEEKGIEYFLIDDSWYKHATKGHFELSPELDLQAVIDYAADKTVELILYYDRKHGEYGDKELFPYYQSLGMKGVKYGFMGNNVQFSRDAISQSADSELLIDFHDSPVPFTGVRRTFPNAITREYCHAQQDSRKAFTPETFIKMALINAIQGPLDMNNGNFDLSGINAGKRQKGPKKLNSYLSTVVSETARTLVIFSGLVCIPDAPEAYAAKSDLFEFIQKMPVGKWDESRILNSKMSEYITTARRSGTDWFVGSVICQKGGTLDISLDFLEEGKIYEATFYEDTDTTDCKTNPEAYQARKAEVKKDQIIKAKLASGGGHCMYITLKE
ncbi:glycoside hydrolase family 97 catalytic domain-containing protein [Algibacter miyuki]|uniref:Glycoside hydrolase family 97 catalytic domain-containing protein n=2 Tax=Algibacter miyuki TaxID=1306933 RepID=A0ABV5GZC7_9FLAO